MLRHSLAVLTGAAALCGSLPAHAVGQRVDVQVVDRGTGETLTPIQANGEWWIAGRPGTRYGVTIVSRDARRTLNVLSVDGVNAISGETAAWHQTGYVLGPREHARIDGWRKDMRRIAAFEFTALPDAYAVRTGRPANVGVIGVAVFDEWKDLRPIVRRELAPPAADRSSGPVPAPLASPPPVASSAPAPASPLGDASRALATPKAELAGNGAMPRERIGTGHGAIEDASIENVAFRRARSTPDEIVTIHYDRAENLIAMGIMAPDGSPIAGGPPPDPFPESRRFVADPPPR